MGTDLLNIFLFQIYLAVAIARMMMYLKSNAKCI